MSAKLASSPANVTAVVGVLPDFITSSPPDCVKLPNVVPPAFNTTSFPAASKLISAAESTVISLLLFCRVIPV